MLLNEAERAIRDGSRGEATRLSLEQQIVVGDFFGAERFVEVSNVHMMGDYEVMENPKDMSARVRPSRVVHFCEAVAVRNNPTAQNVKPKPPNQARDREPASPLQIR